MTMLHNKQVKNNADNINNQHIEHKNSEYLGNLFVFELFSEEMPATMQENAIKQLETKFILQADKLWPNSIQEITIQTYITPQRMVLLVANMPSNTELKTEVRGPRVNANKIGIEGFLKKYNISMKDLIIKGEFYFFYSAKSIKTQNILGIKLTEILESFIWPKSMKWGEYNMSWIRPIHSILCLWNDEIVDFKFGHIHADRMTKGHRFMTNYEIKVLNAANYLQLMNDAFVTIDRSQRESYIRQEIQNQIENQKKIGKLSDSISLIEDSDLMMEITGLIEYPQIFLGRIDEHFMTLPKEVLITTLKTHQKYLMLQDENQELAPYFVITANIKPEDNGKAIIAGNEKILKARLSDAMFFMKQDILTSLDKMTEKLSRVAFHSKIGTVLEKITRMNVIASNIVQSLQESGHYTNNLNNLVQRAIYICKSDIVSEMVKEFPELQGVIGYYYALQQNESLEVAVAIRDHYKPVGPNDEIPSNIIGAIVAIADKLDTLEQMFHINIRPTGSKDPYALRRAALGIIRIICGYKLNISLQSLLIHTNDLVNESVRQFIRDRLDNFSDANYELNFIRNAI